MSVASNKKRERSPQEKSDAQLLMDALDELQKSIDDAWEDNRPEISEVTKRYCSGDE